jgi:transposase
MRVMVLVKATNDSEAGIMPSTEQQVGEQARADQVTHPQHKGEHGRDAETGEIVATVLTGKEAGDAGQVPALLKQVQGKIASVLADGAYDGDPVYRAIAEHQPQAPPSIVIPPRRSAILSAQADTAPSQRDGHIRFMQEHGRSAWCKATGHGRRSLVETAIGRYKAMIGPRMRARTLANQQSEVALGSEVLNRMIRVAKPVSVRIA